MGLDGLQVGSRVRRVMAISIRICYKSVWNHPLVVGLVCFLVFLYRSSPFVFYLLTSTSPILVCTAVLLGVLLSFGQPNIPEIEKEEKVLHRISSLKTGVAEDPIVLQTDESIFAERHVEKLDTVVEKAAEEVNLADDELNKVQKNAGSVNSAPLVDESLGDVQCEKRVVEEVERGREDFVLEQNRDIQEMNSAGDYQSSIGRVLEDQRPLIDQVVYENLKVEDDRSPVESGNIIDGEHLDLMAPWRHISKFEADDAGGDDESLDSESDGAESSSPDASMADIIPMLDELHPLLDLEAPQHVQMDHDGSDAASEESHDSDEDESVESDADTEIHGDEGDENDGHNDVDEGEVVQEDKDGSKSAIKWTEDDQKNLMDLGSSELERNQRLESLIARRRARKNMRLMTEKNLIDLDSTDIPFNIPPISTTRRNPFDMPYDSYDNMGLPPIPGSAPSILQPRRNPFDLPYDSNEEKPDLKGDSFQQEFSMFQQREVFPHKEAVFRRHESFNVGPSTLGVPRQDLRWKPYFFPERSPTEGTSSPSFRRQLSGVSESKMSSVPDTDSVGSVVDEEDQVKNEQGVSNESDLDLNADHVSMHDHQGSQSSGDVDFSDIEEVESRDARPEIVEVTLGDVESQQENQFSVPEAGANTLMEINVNDFISRTEQLKGSSSRSSLSSLSEINEKISDDKREESGDLESSSHPCKESGISTQPSLEGSEFNFTCQVVDDRQCKEPVYDSSPLATKNLLSFSSVSSDNQLEICETSSPPAPVESLYKVPEMHGKIIDLGTSSSQELHTTPSQVLSEDEQRVTGMSEISEFNAVAPTSSQISFIVDDHNETAGSESLIKDVSLDSTVSSPKNRSVDDVTNEESFHNERNLVESLQHAEMHPGFGYGEVDVSESTCEDVHFSRHAVLSEPVEGHAVDVEETKPEIDSPNDDVREEDILHEDDIALTEPNDTSASGSKSYVHVDVHHNFVADPFAVERESEVGRLEKPSQEFEECQVQSSISEQKVDVEEDPTLPAEQSSEIHQNSSSLEVECLKMHNKEIEGGQVLLSNSDPEVAVDEEPILAAEQSSEIYQNLSSSEAEYLEKHSKEFEGGEIHSSCYYQKVADEEQLPLAVEQSSDGQQNSSPLEAGGLGEHSDKFELGEVQLSSSDQKVAVEEQLFLAGQQTSEVHQYLSLPEAECPKKHIDEFEKVEVQLSRGIEKADTDLYQDINLDVATSDFSHQDGSQDKYAAELEREMSTLDKSMVESSLSDHHDLLEPVPVMDKVTNTGPVVVFSEEVNAGVPEVHDLEHKISVHFSCITSDLISNALESAEDKSQRHGEDLKDSILDRTISTVSTIYNSPVSEKALSEEADQDREIEESILSELDAVGDFNVKEIAVPEEANIESASSPDDVSKVKVDLPIPEEVQERSKTIVDELKNGCEETAEMNVELPLSDTVNESSEGVVDESKHGHEETTERNAQLPSLGTDHESVKSVIDEPKHGCDEAIEMNIELPPGTVHQISQNIADEPNRGYEETYKESSSSMLSDQKGKKAKSQGYSSRSISSSSSDSDDSDRSNSPEELRG